MLTTNEIKKLAGSGCLGWGGDLRGNALLLRLGSPIQHMHQDRMVDLADQNSIDELYHPPRSDWDHMDLERDQMVLCQTADAVSIDSHHAGAIGTLSHLARVGLATHVASPWVLPGWNGSLTLELHNVGPKVLRLYRRMPVARLLLFAMAGEPTESAPHPFYGSHGWLGSRYASEFPFETYRDD